MLHVNHLRQVYELIGLGQHDKAGLIKKQYGGAKYIVYNDPQSNTIRVMATSSIAKDILDKKHIDGNPFKGYETEITRSLKGITSTDTRKTYYRKKLF